MDRPACPFCKLPPERVFGETSISLAFFDAFPVAEGHALVIPKRHVPSIFGLPPEELTNLWEHVARVRNYLSDKFNPDGFNIGINDGIAAGQTVPHGHI